MKKIIIEDKPQLGRSSTYGSEEINLYYEVKQLNKKGCHYKEGE